MSEYTKAENDAADLTLLSLASAKRKFGLSLGGFTEPPIRAPIQAAFERGIDYHWFDLVDVSPLPAATGDLRLMRVFRLTDAGHQRLRDLGGSLQS